MSIPHNQLTFDEQEANAVANVIKSGFWAGGNVVEALEKELSSLTSCKYAVAVSSGFSALRLSLLALGVKAGDEVIVPAYACVALANAVLAVGAKPIAVDVQLHDFNIDPIQVKKHISERTKAIIAVHTFGTVADIQSLREYNIPIIEDCAHAIGLKTEQGILGNLGDVAITSFYATKLIGGGEGGAILTNNKTIAESASDTRDYTDKLPSAVRQNDKMSDIHAAVSLVQVKKLQDFIIKRKALAENYLRLLANLQTQFPYLVLPANESRIWYRFIISLKGMDSVLLIDELKKLGVSTAQPVELWLNESEKENCPNAVTAFKQVISLPLYPNLTAAMQEEIVLLLAKALNNLNE